MNQDPNRDLPPLTRAQVRELDRLAMEELGIPGVVLMENAGRGAAEAILRCGRAGELDPFRGGPAERVAILCGSGNNAGDGYVVARHLTEAGLRVALCETVSPDRLAHDAAVFRGVTHAMGLAHHSTPDASALDALAPSLAGTTLLVDALLGTGFQGELRERAARLLVRTRRLVVDLGAAVVALDVPSGLDVDTGLAAPETVPARRTFTFAAPKIGFAVPSARNLTGVVEVISIGAPSGLIEKVR